MLWPLQRFEPVGWAEGLIPTAEQRDVVYLPRLYVAAALCLYDGRPDLGVEFAERAMELEHDSRFRPFDDGWSGLLAALAHLFAGRIDRRIEISRELADRSGFARVVGLCGLTWALPAVGRSTEAIEIAGETLEAARDYGSPFWIGWALGGVGRAYKRTDPVRALDALREGLEYADEHRLPFWGANLAQDAAGLEAEHGDPDRAIELFRIAIDSFHRAGNAVFLAATLASLAVFLGRRGDSERAAIIYGASTNYASINLVPDLAEAVAVLRESLGEDEFEPRVARGAAMSEAEAVRYAHEQLRVQSRAASI
jgi:tetratricopeptide (TPR) repeat protein